MFLQIYEKNLRDGAGRAMINSLQMAMINCNMHVTNMFVIKIDVYEMLSIFLLFSIFFYDEIRASTAKLSDLRECCMLCVGNYSKDQIK